MNYRKPGAKAVAIEHDAIKRDAIKQSADPFAGSSLVPMLVIGLVMTFAGMIAALVLS
jgi:hypothetical protein